MPVSCGRTGRIFLERPTHERGAHRLGNRGMRFSVIIANYNYRDFVGAAITSALAAEWADKEVIVVDDASTDDSRTIIEGFGNRIAAYFRPKTNQLGAHIFGFEQSNGEIVIFLDADDLLEPDVMREVANVWRPGVSKVQYRMNLIDAAGQQLGTAIPQFPPSGDPAKLRRIFLKTMTYSTPPGSGNAYSRDFLSQAFAFGPSIPQSDAVFLTLAPMLGDVLTIQKPLARYRIHGASWGAMMKSLDTSKLRQLVLQDIERARLFEAVAGHLRLPVSHDPLKHSSHHLQYRLASLLAEPAAHPFREDTKSALVFRLTVTLARASQMRLRDRGILLVWTIVSVLAPQRYRRTLILWRFSAVSRPAIVNGVLNLLTSLRSPRLPDQRRAG